MPRCRHSVLITAFQYAVGEGHCSSCGAPLTCMSTLFNSLTPVIISGEAAPFVACILRNSFAVYRLAGTFRFTTSISVCCDMWPAADLRQMLTQEIDVVQRVVFVNPVEEHLDILLDLPHLNSIHVTLCVFFMVVSCTALARLFQQTTRRSLRRSIARTIAADPFTFFLGIHLFVPLLLDALLNAASADELHDLLLLAKEVPGFPRPYEIDQYMALLGDYRNSFAESTQLPAPLGVYVAAFASALHAGHAAPFDFEPFFKYIWNKYYYETGFIYELLADRKRVRAAGEKPFEVPCELTTAKEVIRNLFDGTATDVIDATRGDVCIDAYFESDVFWYVNNLFRDERFCVVVFGDGCSMSEYDEKIVLFCKRSMKFASEVKNHIFDFGWCRYIRRWAQRRVAHSTRLMHRKGADRATAEKMAGRSAWNAIYDARLIAATLMFGSEDLMNPPRRAVEATQDMLYDLFDEDNEDDDARLIPAFTAVLKAILLLPPDEERDNNGQLVRTIPVLDQDGVKDLFTFLTHTARRERMRIMPESVAAADDNSNNSNDRRRSREQSEDENDAVGGWYRYLPRLLEDNHLRQLMEQEAARGTEVVKALLDELVSEEVIEI